MHAETDEKNGGNSQSVYPSIALRVLYAVLCAWFTAS